MEKIEDSTNDTTMTLQVRSFSFNLNKELERICSLTKRKKGDVVSEAISAYIQDYWNKEKMVQV